MPEELKFLQNTPGSCPQKPGQAILTTGSATLITNALNLDHFATAESRTLNTVITANSSLTDIRPALKLSSSLFLSSNTNIDKSKMALCKEVIRNVHIFLNRYKLSLISDEALEISKLCHDILNVLGDDKVREGEMASIEDHPEVLEQNEFQNVENVELTEWKNAAYVDEDENETLQASTNDSQIIPDKKKSKASKNCFMESNFHQGGKSLKQYQLNSVKEPSLTNSMHELKSVNHSEKKQSAKSNEQSPKDYKKPAHKWAVNRNMKMHYFHRKCESIPTDLTSDNFSPSLCGYFCPDCKFIFISKRKLFLHKQLKQGECSPYCIYCDKDNQKNIFQCDRCPKCFSSQILLDNHIKRHSQRFKCKLCVDTAFYTAQDLKFHQNKIHKSESQMKYLCDLCGAKFKDKAVLNGHRKYVHTDIKPEQCRTCGRNFKTKSQLRNHEVVHKNVLEVNLSCEICGKRFLRAATLKDHIRRHNKEYNEYCKVCGKGFYRKHDLDEHMRVHTGEKPFQCSLCDYKAALSCNLIKHMKVHDKQNMKT